MSTFQVIVSVITVLALVVAVLLARELLSRWRTRRLFRARGIL